MAPATNPDTKKYSWKKASELLSEIEKNRLCCLLLTCLDQVKPTSEDFKAAAIEFNAAQGGFTKMYQNTIKKLKDKECFFEEAKDGEGAKATTQIASDATPPPTESKVATPGTTKRKNAKKGDGDGSPKKRGRPSKAAASANVKEETEQQNDGGEDETAEV